MKTKRKTPEIRFRGFTDDWEQRKLGEVSNISRGASPRPIQSQKWFDDNSEVGWLRISDVTAQNGKIHYLDQRLSLLGQEKTRVLVTPHLLLSIAATVGKPLINYVKTGVHDGFLIFYDAKFNIDFMFQWFEIFRPKWIRYGQPGSQVNLNSEIVKNQEVNMPSLLEQDKISDLFTNVDRTINIHQRKLQQLKEVKRGILLTLLICDKENNPIVRFNGYKNIWETIKLGDNYKFLKGKGLTLKDFSNQGKSKGIAYGHLYTIYSEVILEVNLFVTDETVKSKSGDLLFPGSSTVPFGTAQTNAIMIDGVNLGGDIVIARPKDNSNYAPFMSYLINIMKEKMYPITVGTTITHMYGKDISSLKYNIPKYEEQLKIGEFIQKLDRMIELQEREIELLEETKKGFLQKMFV